MLHRLFDHLTWNEIYALAERQGLAALVMDELTQNLAMTQSIKADEEGTMQVYQLFGATQMMETKYERYERTVKSLSAFARKQGIKMLVLKGYGASLNYPIPSHRHCGDIDVFVINDGTNDYSSLDKAVSENFKIDVDQSSAHHSSFQLGEFLVENHKTVLDPDNHKENEALNRLLAEEAVKDIREENGVLLPSVRFNSIHLLAHMAQDFASVGSNLRQLLDWSNFVLKNSNEIDWDYVFKIANEFGMTPFLNALNAVCTEKLGYSKEMFPVRIKKDEESGLEKITDKVFADLLKGSNKKLLPSQTNILHYGLVETIHFFQNYWKHKMVYKENIFASFWTLAKMRWAAK